MVVTIVSPLQTATREAAARSDGKEYTISKEGDLQSILSLGHAMNSMFMRDPDTSTHVMVWAMVSHSVSDPRQDRAQPYNTTSQQH